MPSNFQWSNPSCEIDLSHIHGCQYMTPRKPGVSDELALEVSQRHKLKTP